jgi:hypothetical protein
VKLKYRILLSLIALGGFVASGCSAERELPVGDGKQTESPFDKGSLSNPLKVQKPVGKRLSRRGDDIRQAGR